MGNETEQAKLLRGARERLGITSDELAARLGTTPDALQNWLRPPTSKRHRQMPEMARLLLARILKDKPKKRRK